MEVINIIVHDSDTGIISIDSFGVADSQLRNEVVAQAESAFFQKCVDLKFGENSLPSEAEDNYRDEIGDTIEDGYCEVGSNTVSFVWSYIENVQL